MHTRTKNLRNLAAALAVAVAAVATRADDPVTGVPGVRMPNRSRVTTALDDGPPAIADEDDYVVLLERGRTLVARVSAARGSDLSPALDLLRSDDTLVATVSGESRALLRFVADATDAYRVRVRNAGERVTATGYTLSVAISGPVTAQEQDAQPDGTGQFRFLVPARGGARLAAQLRFVGTAPTFDGLAAPGGTDVEGAAAAVRPGRGRLRIAGLRIPQDLAFGEYALRFRAAEGDPPASVRFSARVTLPKSKPRRGRLSDEEPWIRSVVPAAGVRGGAFVLDVRNAEDPREGAPVRVRLGVVEAQAAFPDPLDRETLRVTVTPSIPLGVHDVVLETATGQVVVLRGAFRVITPPQVTSFEPAVVAARTGGEVTIHGAGFRPGRTGVRIGGSLAPVTPIEVTPTTVRFLAPPRAPGVAALGVADLDVAEAFSDFHGSTLEWAAWPWIGSVSPQLVNMLGGETVSVSGAYFAADDRLWLETSTPGEYEELTGAYRTETHDEFEAPVRPPGAYRLYVADAEGRASPPVTLTYFSYADASASLGLTAGGDLDACSSALADFDGDGDADLFLTRRGSGAAADVSQTRVLRNDGEAGLVDVTASVLPSASAADDWRADRLRVLDVTGDGRPDLVLATNDASVPAPGKSHVRLLVNEERSSGAADSDRVFRDRTTDLMAPARVMTHLYGSTRTNETDDWRALDLWVGDVDGDGGPPEIVVTTDHAFSNEYVSCSPYCASPYANGYTYSFYWGGTRLFRWNPQARAGLGRYALEANRFPRKGALTIVIAGAPPGIEIPVCNDLKPCRGKFPPFTGRRLEVGRIDGDALLDFAVLGDPAPTVNGQTTSPLQVALFRTNSPGAGYISLVADATPALAALGIDLGGDAVAVAGTPWPGGKGGGLLAVARATAGSGSALRVLRHVADADASKPGTFEDLTASVVPSPSGDEAWQADALAFVDVDHDGDEDLFLLSRDAPGLRVLRDAGAGGGGPFEPYLAALIEQASADRFPGSVLTIGDVDGNGLPDFVVSTDAQPASGPATRVLTTLR